jgi:hypothetical protein
MNSCKIMISDRRNRLKADIIEANECYRSWRASGLVDGVLHQFEKETEMDGWF